MKSKRLLVFAGVFGLGFASAWVSKPAPISGEEFSRARATASERAAVPERPVKGAKNPRTNELLKALGEARYNEPKTKEALDQIKTEEFPRLIDELARKAGFTGLGYQDEKSVRDLIEEWFERDPEAALGWVSALENTKDRELLLRDILGKALKKDLKQGLALLQQYGKGADGDWNMPYGIFEFLGQLSPEDMVRTLSVFISTGGSSSREIELPNGFDFRSALDGLREIQSELKEKESFAIMPALMISWAKLEPGAAWEWLEQGGKVPYNGVEAFFKGYRSRASDSEYASLLAETMSWESDSKSDQFQKAWIILANEPNAEVLALFVQKAPGERLGNLRDLFMCAAGSSGSGYDRCKEMLLSEMSPSERVSIVSDYFNRHSSNRKFFEPVLRQLGHSDEEIQRMLPPAPQY